jgi:hypothetical protein
MFKLWNGSKLWRSSVHTKIHGKYGVNILYTQTSLYIYIHCTYGISQCIKFQLLTQCHIVGPLQLFIIRPCNKMDTHINGQSMEIIKLVKLYQILALVKCLWHFGIKLVERHFKLQALFDQRTPPFEVEVLVQCTSSLVISSMSGKTAPINIVQLQFLYHQYMIVDVLKKVDVISCIIYRYFLLPAGTWFALSLWQKLVAFRLFMESMALLRSRATRRWSRQFSTPVRHATSGQHRPVKM